MSTIKFILRPGTWKKDKNGNRYALKPAKPTSIYLQYSHKGKKELILTGRKCEPRYWDRIHGKPKTSEGDLETRLDELKKEFNNNAVHKVLGELEPDKVKEAWARYKADERNRLPEAVVKGTILNRWDEYIAFLEQTLYKGKRRTKGTIRNNKNSRELLAVYLAAKKRQTIKPRDFTLLDFQKYEAWIVNSPGAFVPDPRMKGKKRKIEIDPTTKAPNGIAKALKHLKSFLKWHLKNGGLVGFDPSTIEYSEVAGIKLSLTENEIATVAQNKFERRLNLVRDLMVLHCSTGVRISDLQRLCSNLNEDKTAFKIKTKKKGKFVLVPILPLAKEVLKRHHYKLPLIPESKYREGIKAIYKSLWPNKKAEVGEGDSLREILICEEISSHDMVRTFINIAWKKGLSVPTIALITGKTIPVLLKNYLNEDEDHAAKEMLEKFDLSPLRIAK